MPNVWAGDTKKAKYNKTVISQTHRGDQITNRQTCKAEHCGISGLI